jgi:predicted transcriptional regulator
MSTYILKINNELWQKFKKTISKSETINQAIEKLIKEKVENTTDSESKHDL